MVDTIRLSDLDEANPLENTALLPVIQSGAKRTTVGAIRDRTSHTGFQPIGTITGLQTAIDGKSATGHAHQISDSQGLQTALDGKSASGHSHTIANVTGLQTAIDGKAAASHSHDATALTTGTVDLARLPVAASGVSDATKLVRADDSRLSGGGGSGGGFKNFITNGCCRVSHRTSKSLSGGWQYAQVDLIAVRADGSPTAGTIKQATGVTSLGTSGYACHVQGASLNSSGAVYWRHRIEVRDAIRLRNAAAVLSARTYHDTGAAITYTLTINKTNAADDFSAVTLIASGTVSVATRRTETRLGRSHRRSGILTELHEKPHLAIG